MATIYITTIGGAGKTASSDCTAPPEKEDGLPPLTGTPEQIKRAAALRALNIEKIKEIIRSEKRIRGKAYRAFAEKALSAVLAQTSAEWWISHYYSVPAEIVSAALANGAARRSAA